MAATQFKQETVDPLDIDEYLDFNQGTFSPSSTASSIHSHVKASQTPEISTPRASQAKLKQPANPNTFAGPSHQYDLHKQTTGLPVGAVANTVAAARQSPFRMNSLNGVGGFRPSNNVDDVFDFNAMPPASFAMSDMEMDFDTPADGYMPSQSGPEVGFVDPHAIGGQSSSSSPVRLWPGMHTQQAALAKQQQQEILRQQQIKMAAQQQQAGQQPVMARPTASKSADPVVEERISRLLNQMRHDSNSSIDSMSAAMHSSAQRPKKDEEDMDEDERLLASEEGKKLSSKERRQLRNKVSARAFRSRRKEYITQLEGEISHKANETEELRAENAALRVENSRLTDLSKMLLASPAFSNFLNDLSANGMPAVMEHLPTSQQRQPAQPQPQPQPQQQQQQQQQQQRPKSQTFKDANPHQQQAFMMQPQQMAMNNGAEDVDFSNLDANGSWGVGMDFGFDAQVFAVTELPQGPAVDQIDTSALSGKYSDDSSSFDAAPTKAMPIVEPIELPTAVTQVEKSTGAALAVDESVDFDESNPAYALFADDAAVAISSIPTEQPAKPESTASLEKPARIELVVRESEVTPDPQADDAAMRRFMSICSRLDQILASIR